MGVHEEKSSEVTIQSEDKSVWTQKDDCMLGEPSSKPDTHAKLKENKPRVAAQAAGVLAGVTALAACGGGGSGGTNPVSPLPSATTKPTSTPSPTATATSVPQKPALTKQEAARFLQQAQFSSTEDEIAALQSVGIESWLDAQFEMPISKKGWDWAMEQKFNTTQLRFQGFPVNFMMWHQLFTAPDTLRKRVALALSEIFVVSEMGLGLDMRVFALGSYWDLLNTHAFGNYRELLEAVTLSPSMGSYLNTKGNRRADAKTGRRPDENYAREVLQLFSIGLVELNQDGTPKKDAQGNEIETYDQDTVLNLARVFTGWDLDRRFGDTPDKPFHVAKPMLMNEARHSPEEKRFFNTVVPAVTPGAQSLRMAMDAIASHANVAPFICKQLIMRLVTSNPSPNYVGRVAAVFNDNGEGVRGDLKAVVKTILLDDEARAETGAAYRGKVREPMLRQVQWFKTFSTRQSVSGEWLLHPTQSEYRLAQSPFRSTSVFNFFSPFYAPLNTQFSQDNLVAPELQIADEATVAGYASYMFDTIRNGLRLYDYADKYSEKYDVLPDYSKELTLVAEPQKLVEHLNLVLCAGQMSSTTRNEIIRGLLLITEQRNKEDWQIERVYFAVLCTMLSPDYLVLE